MLDQITELVLASKQIPLWVIVALLTIAPNLPIPSILITTVCGTALALRFGVFPAIVICTLGYAIAFTWVYVLKKYIPLKIINWIQSKISKLRLKPTSSGWATTAVVRNLPGVPLCVQTYVLLLLNVPFYPYFSVSCIMQLIGVTTFLLIGKSAMQFIGQPWMLALIFVAILLVILTIQVAKRRLKFPAINS